MLVGAKYEISLLAEGLHHSFGAQHWTVITIMDQFIKPKYFEINHISGHLSSASIKFVSLKSISTHVPQPLPT